MALLLTPDTRVRLPAETDSPASAAKLTLEGLEHWRIRLSREVSQLQDDINVAQALADRWCGKCGASLHELKALHAKKEADHEACERAISAIRKDLQCATSVAQLPGKGPTIVVPRTTLLPGPNTGKPTVGQTHKARAGGSREMSRAVARKSAILANSPDDVTRKLIF